MRVILICIMFACLASCGSSTFYEKNYDFIDGVWKHDNPSSFDFTISDNNSRYDLLLDIEHSSNFPFENLYLKINTKFPDQSTVSDTLSIEMINRQGAWIGKCTGENCRLRVVLQEQIKFKNSGDHSIMFEQFTREDNLQGVNSIGLKLLSSK